MQAMCFKTQRLSLMSNKQISLSSALASNSRLSYYTEGLKIISKQPLSTRNVITKGQPSQLLKASMNLSLVDMPVSVGNQEMLMVHGSKIMRHLSFQYLNRQNIYAITNKMLLDTSLTTQYSMDRTLTQQITATLILALTLILDVTTLHQMEQSKTPMKLTPTQLELSSIK